MKIIVCPDSFKGSLTSHEVSDVIGGTISSLHPDWDVVKIPLADGGEGSSFVLSELFPRKISAVAADPLFNKIDSYYRTDLSGKRAFIECASIIGLPLVPTEKRNPLKTSSFGLGELILHAVNDGVSEIFISLGGSATCDAGLGMLQAMGLQSLDFSSLDPNLNNVTFHAVCDVTNPLFGPNGASYIFAPQKGALPHEVEQLERNIKQFYELALKQGVISKESAFLPGCGAAGGIGFALSAFLGADIIRGIDFILDMLNFRDKIKNADLIITGEGKVDRQSLMGKTLSGVLQAAQKYDIPVMVIAGKVEDRDLLENSGVKDIIEIADPYLSEAENMKSEQTLRNLCHTVTSFFT